MLDALSSVLTRPVSFFRELARGEKVGGAIWTVLLVSLVSAAASYFLGLPFQEALATAPFAAATPIITAAAGFFTPFITWLFYGLLVRVGAGMEAKPWAVAGYALAPQVVLNALLLVIVVAFPVEVTPVNVDVSDTQAFEAANARVQREIASSVAGRAGQLIGYLGTLWWIALIFLGVRETANQQQAIRATFLVGIVAASFAVGSFIFAPSS